MFKSLRTRIGQYYFRKEQIQTERNCRVTTLNEAKKIGILYTLDDIPDYDLVSQFVSELQHDHKEVKALGFVKNKSLLQRFLPKLSFDFFSRRDLTWFYKPIHKHVRDFIEKEFDLLIDLSLRESFPLQYISGCSNALCRVGKFSETNTEYYDFMIDLKPAMTTGEFLEQIRHYLSIINSHAKRP